MKRLGFPFQRVGTSNQTAPTKGGCGCGSSNGCGCGGSNVNGKRLNGTLEDILSNLASGQPLTVIDIGIEDQTLIKMGLGALALILINKEINKK